MPEFVLTEFPSGQIVYGNSGGTLTSDGTFTWNSTSRLLDIFHASGDTNPKMQLAEGFIKFGSGGASALDVELSRDSAGAMDIQALSTTTAAALQLFGTAANPNINALINLYGVTGTNFELIQFGAKVTDSYIVLVTQGGSGVLRPLVFDMGVTEALRITTDPYVQFGVDITASSDNTRTIGTATTRWGNINIGGDINFYLASGDTYPALQLAGGGASAQAILFGPGGSSVAPNVGFQYANTVGALYLTTPNAATATRLTIFGTGPGVGSINSYLQVYGATGSNGEYLQFDANQSTEFDIKILKTGGGLLRPLVVFMGALEVFRVTTDPYVQFAANITANADNTLSFGTSSVSFAAIYGHGLGIPINTLANGLVGYWPLDEGVGTSAYDLSGNNNTGVITHTPSWVAGYFGNALTFVAASTQVVTIPNTSAINVETVTVAAWVNFATDTIGGRGLFCQAFASAESPYVIKTDGSNHLSFECGDGTHFPTTTSSATYQAAWHFVCGVRVRGVSMTLYVDGAQVSTTSDTTTTTTLGGGAFQIGEVTGIGFGSATIDDVRIYNRALSSAEVLTLYNSYPFNPFVNSTSLLLATANTWSADQTFHNILVATDAIYNIGSSVTRVSTINAQYIELWGASGDTYAQTYLEGTLLAFGAGGSSSPDILLQRNNPGQLYMQSVPSGTNRLTAFIIYAGGTGHSQLIMYDTNISSQPSLVLDTTSPSIKFGSGGSTALDLDLFFGSTGQLYLQDIIGSGLTLFRLNGAGGVAATTNSVLVLSAKGSGTNTIGTSGLQSLLFSTNTDTSPAEAFRIQSASPYFKFNEGSTGSKTNTLGTNGPNGTTTPYTWIKVASADGTTVWIPAWK